MAALCVWASVEYLSFAPQLFSSFFHWFAEASCRSAITTARDVVSDVGVAAASSSVGLLELARCSEKHSERDCHRLMSDKYALSLDVETSKLCTRDESLNIPVIKMRSWCEFLINRGCWHIVCGLKNPDPQREEDILSGFWAEFAKQEGTHQVFQMATEGLINLRRTCPVVLHGDEGRGRKRQAFLVLNFHSLLGQGTQAAEDHRVACKLKRPYIKLRTNFRGHSFTTRFMLAGLRKKEYTGDHEHVFQFLMEFCASEGRAMATTGVKDADGKTFWMIILYICGDWPWLHKCGGLARSFNNVQKRKTLQHNPLGICHQCRAGQIGVPFEQLSTKRPLWLNTEFDQPPTDFTSPFEALPHVPHAFGSLWAFDWFHSWNLGVARNLIGGALALLSEQECAGNIDDRFAC